MPKKFSDYSKEERAELGRKGGYKKKENEEKRNTLRILAEEYGRSRIKNQKIIAMLEEKGIDTKDAIQDMLLILQCFNQISKGNPKWADIYLRIRQESNPDLLNIKKEEMKLRKQELDLKKRLAEKQLADTENGDEKKPQVILYMPNKD